LITPNRTFFVQADTEEERQDWLAAIRKQVDNLGGSFRSLPTRVLNLFSGNGQCEEIIWCMWKRQTGRSDAYCQGGKH